VAKGPNTLLKVNDFRASFACFAAVMTVIVLSSTPATLLEALSFPGRKGLTRQYTLIFPGYRGKNDVLAYITLHHEG
jgi:hypothetical protein